jgi:nitroreductase
MLASLKRSLRARLIACAPCYQRYQRLKYSVQRAKALTYVARDLRQLAAHMNWRRNEHLPREQLQAKLLFYYHKIEKGLSMPGKKRLFGLEVIPQVTSLLLVWEDKYRDLDDPIYRGAVNSLQAYAALLEREQLDPSGVVLPDVKRFLAQRARQQAQADTPLHPSAVLADRPVRYEDFKALVLQRRSYRDFSSVPVSHESIAAAVELAQLSPSACNRQPCRVHVIQSEKLRSAALAQQNGNAGFGHLAPLVLAITSDSSYFFDATERHQPYVDGGLFTMSLIYALQVQGLVSCCLNWCVHPAQDNKLRSVLPLRPSEQVIMLMAVGHPPSAAVVPKSHRRASQDVLAWH